MSNQLQKLAWMVSLALVLVNPPVSAEENQKPIGRLSQLNNIEQSATSIQQLLAQSLIQVTGVNLQATDTGIEVILVTNQSDKLQLT
ncbi:ferrichrome-iron receptor, partial [Nodularia spumigena CCY9414]